LIEPPLDLSGRHFDGASSDELDSQGHPVQASAHPGDGFLVEVGGEITALARSAKSWVDGPPGSTLSGLRVTTCSPDT
jgi:hypothetical protein